MKVELLRPRTEHRTEFTWAHLVTVPDEPGCYALVTYNGDVLYVGLASVSVRDRMQAHLDTPAKREIGPWGLAFWFYYVLRPTAEVSRIERGWMNQAILEDGSMPLLNAVYSPL